MKRKAFMTLVGTVYKKTVEDLADTDLKLSDDNSADDAELDDSEVNKVLTKLDSEKVAAIKKTQFDSGFQKAEKATATKFEKKLKETFEIDDATLQGEDLIDHIKENLPEPGTIPADITKLTEEDVLKVPAVKKLVQGHKKAIGELQKQHTEELDAERNKQGETQTFAEIAKKAAARLTREGFKVNLPEDAAKREARIDKLLNTELKGVKWQKQTDGSFIPVDKDGVQLEDSNGNPIGFDTYVDNIIDSNFDFEVATPDPKSPGNKNQPKNPAEGAKKYVGKKPTNQTEYMELLSGDELDVEQKAALREAYIDQDW